MRSPAAAPSSFRTTALPQWASPESLERGAALIRDGHVDSLIETAFGIRHIEVHDGERTEQVDILARRPS